MRKWWYGCALVGVAMLSSALTAALLPRRQVVVVAAAANAAELAKPKPRQRTVRLPHWVKGLVPAQPSATPITHGPTVTPSLYERTTLPPILRAQGCRAGRAYTNGLVVLDFGKLAYRPRRGGYGTVTFADRFASNRSITWAVKSYARGYSECVPKRSHAHITLARGTSNYDQDVPSTYTAGRHWAQQTALIGEYLRRHNFDHVPVDHVEPRGHLGRRSQRGVCARLIHRS